MNVFSIKGTGLLPRRPESTKSAWRFHLLWPVSGLASMTASPSCAVGAVVVETARYAP
jgi:hypothetical protein